MFDNRNEIKKMKPFLGLCMFLIMFFAALSVNALASGTDSAGTESQTVRYKLTYYLNGGTNNKANPVTYTANDEFTLKSPQKTGYTFGGWYSDSKFTKKVTVIKKGSTGNRTFYAKWTANTYNIKFNGNGAASGKMSTLNSRKYGTVYTLPANAYKAKTGYYFAGWNTRADGKGTSYANKAKVKNLSSVNKKTVTLYAQWKKILAPKASSSKHVYVDRTVTLSVSNLIPGDKVTFKSSNTGIAAVGSTSGRISGKKNGSCTVTATVKRGSKTYTLKTKVTVKTVKTGNTAGNMLMGGYFSVTDGSYTYIAENHANDNYGRIYRVKTADGSGKKQLYKTNTKYGSVQDISIYGDYIYFLKHENGNFDLYRMKKDGTGSKKLAEVLIGGSGTDSNPAVVNMDDTYIYYEEPVSTDYTFKIRRIKLDGSDKKSIYSSKGELCGSLNTAGDKLLLYDRGFDKTGSFIIMKMVKKTGTAVRTLFNYTEPY